MEARKLLEALVATVAALGELAATVTGPDGDVLLAMHPESLREALEMFTRQLCESLGHRDVTYLEHRDVTSLGEALAALKATRGATWADVTAALRAWQESVDALAKSWWWVDGEATDLRDAWENAGTAKATAKATATTRPRDLRDETAGQGTAGDNLGAEVAVGLLGRLVAAFDKASVFPWELQRQLGDIELALEETKEASRNVPEALVAMVDKAELLWEASSRLATCHLLVALGDICTLLSSPSAGSGGPGGPAHRAVAERCQRAIEDIPRLLGGQ